MQKAPIDNNLYRQARASINYIIEAAKWDGFCANNSHEEMCDCGSIPGDK